MLLVDQVRNYVFVTIVPLYFNEQHSEYSRVFLQLAHLVSLRGLKVRSHAQPLVPPLLVAQHLRSGSCFRSSFTINVVITIIILIDLFNIIGLSIFVNNFLFIHHVDDNRVIFVWRDYHVISESVFYFEVANLFNKESCQLND